MYHVKWHIIVGPLLLPFTSYWSVFLLNSRYYTIVNIISYMCMSNIVLALSSNFVMFLRNSVISSRIDLWTFDTDANMMEKKNNLFR